MLSRYSNPRMASRDTSTGHWRPLLKQFILNGPTPASFLFIFGLFKQTTQFLQQINVTKIPSSIWHRDSNPRPFEHESSPTTTRPGLPPLKQFLLSPSSPPNILSRGVKMLNSFFSGQNMSSHCQWETLKGWLLCAFKSMICHFSGQQ